ncbi:MAG: DUF3486 family protein [Desulfitobacteriaceae bacterium]|nr:DUF3486 family protein [Desulfitobacteriaceae bacterium]
MTRRKHHKVTTDLPPELVDEVNRLLVDGRGYQEIADWLKQMGRSISKSSVGRYGKDFLTRLERLKIVRDQARAIVDTNPDRPATELNEAASTLASQLITEALMAAQDAGGELDKKVIEAIKALSMIEKSSVARERLKLEFKQKADAAVKQIEETAKNKNLDQETLQLIKEQIYGLV